MIKKRLLLIFIIIFIAVTSVFAGNSWVATGNPSMTGPSTMDIALYYNPELMQRLSFGFSNDRNIDWNGPVDNLVNNGIYLDTQYHESAAEYARGYGNVNFYWILRTSMPVSAKIYLNSPMTELNTHEMLDWKIEFDTNISNVVSHNKSIDSLYGPDNAVTIYQKGADPEANIVIDYLPIEVMTDYAQLSEEPKIFTGSVAVLVQAN